MSRLELNLTFEAFLLTDDGKEIAERLKFHRDMVKERDRLKEAGLEHDHMRLEVGKWAEFIFGEGSEIYRRAKQNLGDANFPHMLYHYLAHTRWGDHDG